MPFCRECGKEVQDDWITCPYCSISMKPDSKNESSSDSTVERCPACESYPSTTNTCITCGKIACCELCEINYRDSLPQLISRSNMNPENIQFIATAAGTNRYWRNEWEMDEINFAYILDSQEEGLFGPLMVHEGHTRIRSRNCNACVIEIINEKYHDYFD